MGYKYDKNNVLKIGYTLMRKKGYHHTGINEILKKANIPKGSFYNFFASKEDFTSQIIEYYGELNRLEINKHLEDKSKSPYNRLKSLYNSLIDTSESEKYTAGCFLNTISNELGAINKLLAHATDKNFLSWLHLIADCIKEGQLLGEIRGDYSSIDIAEYLHSGYNGSISRMKVTQSRSYMDLWLKMSFEFIKA